MAPKPKHLTNQLNPVKSQWWEIGEQLDVEYGELVSIKRDPTCNDTRKLSEVCHLWIISDSNVTWKRIWDVVKGSPISNQKLCKEIKEFLVQKGTLVEYFDTDVADYAPDIKQTYLTVVFGAKEKRMENEQVYIYVTWGLMFYVLQLDI